MCVLYGTLRSFASQTSADATACLLRMTNLEYFQIKLLPIPIYKKEMSRNFGVGVRNLFMNWALLFVGDYLSKQVNAWAPIQVPIFSEKKIGKYNSH